MLDVLLTDAEEKPNCDEVAFDCVENTSEFEISAEALAGWVISRKSSWLSFAGPLVRSADVDWSAVKAKLPESAGKEIILFPIGPNSSLLEIGPDLPARVAAWLPAVSQSSVIVMPQELAASAVRILQQGPGPTSLAAFLFAVVSQAGVSLRWEGGVVPPNAAPTGWPLPELAPAGPSPATAALLDGLQRTPPEELLPRGRSAADTIAVKAGLLQILDDLDHSHEHSQRVEHQGRHRAADYWHAIMHRREPDDSNSKYWFRNVGSHPVFPELASQAQVCFDRLSTEQRDGWSERLGLPNGWDPIAFVDFCSAARRSEESSAAMTARQIQLIEMLLLLRSTCQDALGSDF